MESEIIDTAAWMLASEWRQRIVRTLEGDKMTTKQIADEMGVEMNRFSRYLRQLRERDVVELLVSEDVKKGRYYSLTDHGERVLDEMEVLD